MKQFIMISYFRLKRVFDFFVSLLALLCFAPLLLIICLLVMYKMGRPVLFRQSRPGLKSQPFIIYKFRTLLNSSNSDAECLPDHLRLTKFGQWLRATSLDELPELWNVIKGDMSLVGPRPLLMEYLPLYNDEQRRRHDVRPGITGWAQVNGRNALSWEEKFKLDIWYVDNASMKLDIKILWETVFSVLKREGISQTGHVTMEPFRGSDS